MKKTEDPYKAMLKLFRNVGGGGATNPPVQIGAIVSSPPEIKVQWNGKLLDKKWFYLMITGYRGSTDKIRGHIISATQNRGGGSGDSAYESHNHDIDNDYTASIVYTDTWQIGDKVLMIPIMGDDNKTVKQFLDIK